MEEYHDFIEIFCQLWHKGLEDPARTQAQALAWLLEGYARTRYGQAHGAADLLARATEAVGRIGNTPYGDTPPQPAALFKAYRRAFPIVTYDQIKPWIDRVAAGEIEALLPEPPVAWAMTRGTTRGVPKRIPITETDLGIRVAAARGLLNHLLRTDQLDAINGYSLNLNYPSVVGTMDVAGQETPYGFSSGIYVRHAAAATPVEILPPQEEIDALGGEMAHNLDQTFIQIRMLNLSKGPAVRAPRAQADKRLYSLAMKDALEMVPNFDLKQGLVEKLLVESDQVKGVVTNLGVVWRGRTVILATGTFLGARIMTGEITCPAGRAGEFPSTGLSTSLRELGFTLGRLQTNTPPRINARTIDFSQTTPQLGSETPLYFGFRQPTSHFQHHPEPNPIYPIPHQTDWRHQLPCYLVYTNKETHQIVRDNLHRSPIASGFIEGVGPRYCPSFEEKIVRFARKDSHQFFLEPEGWRTTEV